MRNILNPEDKARKDIDKMLTDSGWIIQDYDDSTLSVGLVVVVREYPIGKDKAKCLFVDSLPVGVVEAKKAGHTVAE